jgi:hypothetical protein
VHAALGAQRWQLDSTSTASHCSRIAQELQESRIWVVTGVEAVAKAATLLHFFKAYRFPVRTLLLRKAEEYHSCINRSQRPGGTGQLMWVPRWLQKRDSAAVFLVIRNLHALHQFLLLEAEEHG